MIFTSKNYQSQEIGGKARSLAQLTSSQFKIPAWFVITSDHDLGDSVILAESQKLDADLFAVRSSGLQEDGAEHSFAGQFATKLFVSTEDLLTAIQEVRDSNESAHLETYQQSKDITASSATSVIVQAMLTPDASGVAFSKNQISSRKSSLINQILKRQRALLSPMFP